MSLAEFGRLRLMGSFTFGLAIWTVRTVGKIWKSWPVQAEKDGRAVVRVAGVRYERQLIRIEKGDGLESLTSLMQEKYGSRATPASVDAGDLWMFVAGPRSVTEAVQ